jgi:hypothetical protein
MRAPNALMAPSMPGQPQVQLVRMEDGSVVPVQITGATQGVDPRLLSLAEQAWTEILPGGQLVVTTGVSNHSPTNHAPGHAIDYYAQTEDGRRLPWNDPLVRQASERFWELGGHGVGAGPTYMGGQHYHWDISSNGVRSWSDDDGGASDRGPGAAGWLGGVSAPGGTYGGSAPAYDPTRPPSVFNPPPGSNALSPDGAPENDEERERNRERERQWAGLDPRMFMSRRDFTFTPVEV